MQVCPAEFIGFIESQNPLHIKGEPICSHDELMANFFAQVRWEQRRTLIGRNNRSELFCQESLVFFGMRMCPLSPHSTAIVCVLGWFSALFHSASSLVQYSFFFFVFLGRAIRHLLLNVGAADGMASGFAYPFVSCRVDFCCCCCLLRGRPAGCPRNGETKRGAQARGLQARSYSAPNIRRQPSVSVAPGA